jgi:hypothetical protein
MTDSLDEIRDLIWSKALCLRDKGDERGDTLFDVCEILWFLRTGDRESAEKVLETRLQ